MEKKYYSYTSDRFNEGKIKTVLHSSSEAVFRALAKEMVDAILENNAKGEKTVFIVPVGPVGQYPFFIEEVIEKKISLKNLWLINMDDYLDEEGKDWIDINDRLSFRGFMEKNVYSQLPEELNVPEEQRIFPDPADPSKVDRIIEELGKIDICFGGIGINGHLAFNESEDVPLEDFASRCTRVLEISRETRTSNAIGDLGGAIDAMPKYAVTIGMKQILSARKVRLGVFRTWHRAVIRRAIFGEVTPTFPASLLQEHPDALIYVNDVAGETAF